MCHRCQYRYDDETDQMAAAAVAETQRLLRESSERRQGRRWRREWE
jgi:hypothetical protein